MQRLDYGGGYNRLARKLLHISGSIFAFFLGIFPWWVFAIFALVGLALAYWLKPEHGMLRTITKPVDRKRGMISGVRGYFWTATLLALLWPLMESVFHLPHTERYIAFGWLALTLGDGLAGILGPAPSRLNTVPWNRGKTWWGVWGCFLGALLGFAFAFGAMRVDGASSGLGVLPVAVYGIICAALVALAESAEVPVDDNYVVGLGAPLIALAVMGIAGAI